MVSKRDDSRGGPRGAAAKNQDGWRAQPFPGQEAAGWARVCAPGRCHAVRKHGARGEEPARQTRAARGPGGRARPGAQVSENGEVVAARPPRHRAGQGAVSKVAVLVCPSPRAVTERASARLPVWSRGSSTMRRGRRWAWPQSRGARGTQADRARARPRWQACSGSAP